MYAQTEVYEEIINLSVSGSPAKGITEGVQSEVY
jgi:hypothetical protein